MLGKRVGIGMEIGLGEGKMEGVGMTARVGNLG